MRTAQANSPSLLWQIALVLAALDSAAAGAWALFRPGDLFGFLQYPSSDDRLLLCRALGLLLLTHAPCLLLAAFRSGFAGLTLFPLSGRLLLSGLWLWLLGSGRAPAAGGALTVLLAHDAVWPPLLTAFLGTRGANRAESHPVTADASPGPALPASPAPPPA